MADTALAKCTLPVGFLSVSLSRDHFGIAVAVRPRRYVGIRGILRDDVVDLSFMVRGAYSPSTSLRLRQVPSCVIVPESTTAPFTIRIEDLSFLGSGEVFAGTDAWRILEVAVGTPLRIWARICLFDRVAGGAHLP